MKITNKLVLFFGKGDVCSNFYPCKIIYKDYVFNCSEQLFMYLKACFFKYKEIATKILKTKTPKEAKSLGRMVSNFNGDLWNDYRDNIMLEALMAKYKCCQNFRKFLSENDDKTFAEASPYDKIWGIGLAETDPNSTNPEKWIGENRLGKCLNKLINMVNKTEL